MRYEALTDAEILRDIRHPQDKRGDPDPRGAEWVIECDNTSRWLWGLGRAFEPDTIGEIGVRFGYSLYALAAGAGTQPQLVGWDNQTYFADCLGWAHKHLAPVAREVELFHADTQQMGSLLESEPRDWFDIFSVDGDHSQEGCAHDMELAWPWLRPGGLLLVDDIDYEEFQLKPIVSRFAKSKDSPFLTLPTTRGLGIIIKSSKEKI